MTPPSAFSLSFSRFASSLIDYERLVLFLRSRAAAALSFANKEEEGAFQAGPACVLENFGGMNIILKVVRARGCGYEVKLRSVLGRERGRREGESPVERKSSGREIV